MALYSGFLEAVGAQQLDGRGFRVGFVSVLGLS